MNEKAISVINKSIELHEREIEGFKLRLQSAIDRENWYKVDTISSDIQQHCIIIAELRSLCQKINAA